MNDKSPTLDDKRFAIAVSFPGEDREIVMAIADELARQLGKERIFYDEWYEHELAGVDGDLKLRRYYREQSQMIVPFFSRHYPKAWCKVEWSAIRSVLLDSRKDDLIIPVALDDTPIDGWEKTDFAIRRKQRSPIQIADVILKAYYYRVRKSSDTVSRLIDLPEEKLPAVTERDVADERDRRRRGGIGQLKAIVAEILQAEPTRRFILRGNQLPPELSSEDLTDRIFQIVPGFRSPEEYHTPMCFLHRSDSSSAIAAKDLGQICDHLGRLSALLAPVSFDGGDASEIQQMIEKVTDHARVASKKPVVGASLVAAFLGLEVDLNCRETVEFEGNWQYEGKAIRSKRKLHPSVLIPVDSIDNNGIVDAVARGLAPQVGAADVTIQSVRARLSLLARGSSYICLWFNRAIGSDSLELLKKAFPELIILVSHKQQESQINAMVYEQLQDIQRFIKDNQ